MSRWFRFYDDVMDDPKVQLLSDAHYRAWTTLLCVASKNDGGIPGDEAVLSFTLRKSVGKVRDILQALLSAKLIDRIEGGYAPHNWNGRQFKSDVSNERVKRHRERTKAATGNTDVTLHVTPPESDTDSETEQKQESSAPQAVAPRSKPKKPRRPLPQDFPLKADTDWAIEHWTAARRPDLCARLEAEIQKFRDRHTAQASLSADWSASWRTWAMNAIPFNKDTSNAANNPRRGAATAHQSHMEGLALLVAEDDRRAQEQSGAPRLALTPPGAG